MQGAKVDGRSDLFSVGCMLYELLTGRRPFHSDNLMAIFYKITHEEPNFDLVPEGAEYDALHADPQEVAGQGRSTTATRPRTSSRSTCAST